MASIRSTLTLQARPASAHFELATVLAKSGLWVDAVEGYRKVIECDPTHATAYKNLGNVLNMRGRFEEAKEVWARWLEQEPESPVAKHMVATTTGHSVPARADGGFVRELFDGFARTFDERLKLLGYRASELVKEELEVSLGAGELGTYLQQSLSSFDLIVLVDALE